MTGTDRTPAESVDAAIGAFRSVMTGMKEPCLLVGADASVVVANSAAHSEFGREHVGNHVNVVELLGAGPDGDSSLRRTSVEQFLENAWRSGQAVPATVVAGEPLRRWRCEAWRLRVGPDGRPAPFLVLRFRPHARSIEQFAVIEAQLESLNAEVREHRATAARLRATTDKLETIFGSAPIGMAVAEAGSDGTVVLAQTNAALRRLAGLGSEDRKLVSLTTLLDHEEVQRATRSIALLRENQQVVHFDATIRHASGEEIAVTVSASRLNDQAHGDDSASVAVVLQFVDLTERRRYEAQLRYLADHDVLTGLLNRRRFDEELDAAVARVRRYGTEASLLLIDLDDFKGVNDAHGHAVGDRLLASVADALRERLRDTDVFARHGGDEFAVLLWDTDVDDAVVVAESLRAAILEAVVIDAEGRSIRASGTIGVAPLTGEGAGEHVLVEADVAMYEAKRSGRDRVGRADPTGELRDRARIGHAWVQRIREAFASDRFVLFAQPLLHLSTGSINRHEILLRMDNGSGGVITPAEFLAVAERYGLIHSIDRWVVDHSVSILEAWQSDPLGARATDVLEVNLSGATITDEATIDFIERRVLDSGIDATRLVFEITETAAIVNIERAQKFAHRLAACGCGFALDDVGSGFGSFYYLKHLPADVIKIDGDYIRDLPSSPVDQLIVRAIVDIARGMNKEVVAEWVDSQETLELLVGFGVDYAQGYHVGRPGPVDDLLPPQTQSVE